MQAAQRAISVGASSHRVTELIGQVCEEFGVNPVEGVLSHKMKRHLIDGNDSILNKETADMKVTAWEFQPGDVIGLDVYVSTGEGKPKEGDYRSTIFKRELDTQYSLKINKARQFFAEVHKKSPTLPFSLRSFEDSTGAKVGVKECLSHGLLIAYPVLVEKSDQIVAHFKCTIALMPS